MFRKLTDKLTAAVTGGPSSEEQGVQALRSMGFGEQDARNALRSTNGNVDRAAELLLASATPAVPAARRPQQQQSTNQDELNRAMQESLQVEEARQLQAARAASAATAPPIQSAAASRAGQAAVLRAAAKNPTDAAALPTMNGNKVQVCAHHPTVKMPKKFEDKTKEEQLLRCCDRMKSHPRAVDTIYICLTAIQKDPANDKYRKVDKSTAGYQRSLAVAPGAEDMLKAMNFEERGTFLILSRERVDAALLYLGISALEKTQETTEYLEGKRKLQFEKQVATMFRNGNVSEQDAIARANYMSKCPTEPTGGRGALIQVKIGDDVLRRKFDGDDTLDDILNWLGGHAPQIPEKLLTREWSLMDLNRYPIAPTDCEDDGRKTLQYLGLFPSGRLEIVPSKQAWHSSKRSSVKMGSARGLGAAPRLSTTN